MWSKYGKKLEDFKSFENSSKAVHCLNDLVTNALRHIPDVMEYMSRLKNQSVFNFCAIPQVSLQTVFYCTDVLICRRNGIAHKCEDGQKKHIYLKQPHCSCWKHISPFIFVDWIYNWMCMLLLEKKVYTAHVRFVLFDMHTACFTRFTFTLLYLLNLRWWL